MSFSLFYIRRDRHSGPSYLLCNGYRGTFVGIKPSGLVVNSPPLHSSEVLSARSMYPPSVPSRHSMQKHFTVLGSFAASRSLLASPCPSGCLSECIIAARTGQSSVTFFIEFFFFLNLSIKSNSFNRGPKCRALYTKTYVVPYCWQRHV